MVTIIPSIASANLISIKEEILRIGPGKQLHLDIEDGNFVPNITFGTKIVKEINDNFNLSLNIHLMTNNPFLYIADLVKYNNVKKIVVHIESIAFPLQIINYIKSLGLSAGLALNLKTPIEEIACFKNEIDFILIMTSEPDNKGQIFNHLSLEKIKEARMILPLEKHIWVDGGIGEKEIKLVYSEGADTIIIGRAIFNSKYPHKKIKYLKSLCK